MEETMLAIESVAETTAIAESTSKSREKKRDRVSMAELYSVLEALLPFAERDVEFLVDCAENFPD